MVGYHCGGRNLYTLSNNPVYFTRKCSVCKQVFKQYKRRSQNKKHNVPERESESSKHCDSGYMNDVRFGDGE